MCSAMQRRRTSSIGIDFGGTERQNLKKSVVGDLRNSECCFQSIESSRIKTRHVTGENRPIDSIDAGGAAK